jgi:putative oxidoreductase
MSYGLLLIRIVLGGTMAAHGAQKLFGWFGGPGRAGTAGFFAGLELQPAGALALVAGLAEFCGGILLALGPATPFAALAIAAVMVTAVSTVHWKNGFFAGSGGYEFNLLIYAVAVGLAATGSGRFSLDAAGGWAGNLSGLWWGVGVLGVSVLAGLAMVEVGRLGSRRRRWRTLPT